MTWKSVFSGIAVFAFLALFLNSGAFAQSVRLRKIVSGSDRPERRGSIRVKASENEFQIHYLVNNERRRRSLSDLYWDEELARLARAFSRQMARESFFSHFDPDGKSVVERAENSGIRGWSKIGENLFLCEGYDEFDALAVQGWMDSSEHRRNILDRHFNTTGIGIAETRRGQVYITQVFTRN
jgi:uncharacterized protein YkwD